MRRLEAVFTGVRQPGVYRWASRAHPAAVVREAQRNGWSCAVLHGHAIADTHSFVDACARALRFPAYAGGNRDAFETCLRDLSWLPAVRGRVLLYDDGATFATSAPGEWAAAVDLLRRAIADRRPDDPPLYVLVRGAPGGQLPLL